MNFVTSFKSIEEKSNAKLGNDVHKRCTLLI